jgi:tRNA A-37 threonylcarbamoyl transferase component Bud32
MKMLEVPSQESSVETGGRERSTVRRLRNRQEGGDVVEENQEADQDRISDIREKLNRPDEDTDLIRQSGEEAGATRSFSASLYGDFAEEAWDGNRLKLKGRAQKAVEKATAAFHSEAKYVTNTITGEPIAAGYETHATNFRTQTRLETLPDGRRIFISYDHRGSWIHRGLDNLMKQASGLKMRKGNRTEWKTWHEEGSMIPMIENDDPHTVVMPYVPNVNAYDIFLHSKEISDFGECEWVKDLDAEGKLSLACRAIDKVRQMHGSGKSWGEATTSNIIFTQDQEPILCDWEVRYDESKVSFKEACARDLKDLCMSISSALTRSEGMETASVVQRLLDQYGDVETVVELQNLVHQKFTLLQRLVLPYELARSRAEKAEQYEAVLEAIREYDTGRLLKKRGRAKA